MRLFICTVPEDDELLPILTDALSGYRMTIDVDRMISVRDNKPALQAAIQDCEAFVFVLTPQSATDSRCHWEYHQAILHNRPVVVALLEDVDQIPKPLRSHPFADLLDEQGEEILLDALFTVGATPPSVLAQIARNRVRLLGVVVAGLIIAFLVAGPQSPLRARVNQTLIEVIAIADRTTNPFQEPEPDLASQPRGVPAASPTPENPVTLLAAGQDQLSANAYPEAIDVLTRAVQTDPNLIEAYLARGDAFRAIDDLDAAWGDYTRVIELAPDRVTAYLRRAEIYAVMQNFDAAFEDIETALSIAPEAPQIIQLQGDVLAAAGDYETAVQTYTRAIDLCEDCAEIYQSRAEAYLQSGQDKRARVDLDTAISLNPLLASAFTSRGTLLAEFDPVNALDDLSRAIELTPKDAEARYQRGLLYAADGQFPLAVTDFTRAISEQPDRTVLYLRRGSAYRCQEDAPAAVADFTRAAERDIDETVAYLRTLTAYFCAGQPSPGAQPARLGDFDPDLDAVYLFLAEQLAGRATEREAAGDLRGALSDYALALSLTPSYTELAGLYRRRGSLYENRGEMADALADYEAALDILPEDANLHVDRARMQVATGDIEAAFASLRRAIDLDPINIPAYLSRGDLEAALGDYETALETYNRAFFIDRDNPRTLSRRVRLLVEQFDDCAAAEEDLLTLRNNADPNDIDVQTAEATFAEGCGP